MRIQCTDLPGDPADDQNAAEDNTADVVALPLSATGEADLARDLVQSAHERLGIGGKLYASTTNRDDTWLGEQLAKIFRQLKRRKQDSAVLYVATKTEPLKKRKNYSCEFAFRDRGRLIRRVSRPGVFSHRHIDPGAGHLIDTMRIEQAPVSSTSAAHRRARWPPPPRQKASPSTPSTRMPVP